MVPGSAISSQDSPYRDWYVWSEDRAVRPVDGIVFPGEQTETWTYEPARAGLVLPPLLRLPARPGPRESRRTGGNQADHGLLAAARRRRLPHRRGAVPDRGAEPDDPNPPKDYDFLTELRQLRPGAGATRCCWPRRTSSRETCVEYFGDDGGSGNRMHMLFDFLLNDALVLALARGRPSRW